MKGKTQMEDNSVTRKATLCLLFVVLSFLLTACFRDTITEFENCVPEVTLVSTEATPTIEIIQASSGWSSFEIERDEYYVYVNLFGESSSSPDGIRFTSLPIGTEVNLDGYVAAYRIVAVDNLLYFRGDINGETVWMTHRDAQNLADPANEDSLKKLGLIDETGKEVVFYNWECPNER